MKSATKYFDVHTEMANFEKETGLTLHEDARHVMGIFEIMINRAFEEGYKAGQEAAHG